MFPEKCSGCGNCVKKCQINALSLIETEPGNPKSKKAHVNKNRCIGCGLLREAAKKAGRLKDNNRSNQSTCKFPSNLHFPTSNL
ncbi:4Fe-4S binding protein [Carboxydothermus ferrireducens]|uniref:4Fe-4S binding protein n=1 Tax=Carboxydothermus ferrireducens TaxID=54265 RepID=UPI001FE08212|nr:4Fe-4S binding protein [Carboxydothermus ferrireducens]